MNKLYIHFKTAIWYLVIPVAIFFLFEKGISAILSFLIVDPVLSFVSPPSLQFDIAILAITTICIIPIFLKVGRVADKWLYLAISYIIIYLHYRFSSTPFVFTPFAFSDNIKLLDALSLIPLPILVSSIYYSYQLKKKEELREDKNGFAVDEAMEIDPDNDILNRGKFIKEIADKIVNTNTPKGSFPIGVVAAWGSGKSTILKTLLKELRQKEIISIELNVWQCSSSAQIIETFFKILQEELSKYSYSINNKIQNYLEALLKGTKNEGLNIIRNLSELLSSNSDLAEQHRRINGEIKIINKKIVILIDDLDRLDKKEIYEVIRLIRNTANFANTFFIVAYDRNYILNAIEEINPYQSHLFLEKIFQLEFTLPPVSKAVLNTELKKRITSFLIESDRNTYEAFTSNDKHLLNYHTDLTETYISNIRDVVRFVNDLRLSYNFIKGEIFFPDFYNLQLIHFKHPEIFAEIYRNHSFYFSTQYIIPISGDSYSLRIQTKSNGEKTDLFELQEYLKSNKSAYKISDSDVDIIVQSYSSLFPQKENFISGIENKRPNLSVTIPSVFPRYFVLGIEESLSYSIFSKMRRDRSLDEFKKYLTDVCRNKELVIELAETFEHIKDFPNKEDFERVIKAILHFASLPHPARAGLINYNTKELTQKIANKESLKFYNNDINEYKRFLYSILKTNSTRYGFENEFTYSLLTDNFYYINDILTAEETSDILFQNFNNALLQSETLSLDLWYFFRDCRTRKEVPTLQGREIHYPDRKQAKILLKEFILKKGMDGFLKLCIQKNPREDDRYLISNIITRVYDTNEEFISILRDYKGDSIYKSTFLRLYKDLNTIEEYRQLGVPKEYVREIIED